MSSLPTPDQVRTLPAFFDQKVEEGFIDENLHMNIAEYFRLGTWATWLRLGELGMGEQYIPQRGLSFFTVEHHIRYLGELRLGQPFRIHTGLAGRTAKALHGIALILDVERDSIACVVEEMYVHVSMESRRSQAIPDDVGASLDAEIAAHPWVAEIATGLRLRR